jgi:hypothetical protein
MSTIVNADASANVWLQILRTYTAPCQIIPFSFRMRLVNPMINASVWWLHSILHPCCQEFLQHPPWDMVQLMISGTGGDESYW